MGKIDWYKRYPSKALVGMKGLTLEERGAYNTVLDLIYEHENWLEDDDRFLAGWCGVDVRVWRRIRARLIDLGKLYIEAVDNVVYIRNGRADEGVLDALSRITSARNAGLTSASIKAAKSGTKYRPPNGLAPTTVPTPVSTAVPTSKRKKEESSFNGATVEPSNGARSRPEGALAPLPPPDLWQGKALALATLISPNSFKAFFAQATYNDGPPPMLTLPSLFTRKHVADPANRFLQALEQVFGTDLILAAGPASTASVEPLVTDTG